MASKLVPPVVYKTLTGDYGYTQRKVPSLVGRTAVLTGGTNGIGLSLARTLYSHGMNLHVIASSKETATGALEYIKTGRFEAAPEDYQQGFSKGEQDDTSGGGTSQGTVEFVQCDLSDLRLVAETAKTLKGKLTRLDNVRLLFSCRSRSFLRMIAL